VRKKEALVTEMYLSDRDLYTDARRYAQTLSDLACEVQQLAFLNTALHKSKKNLSKLYSFLITWRARDSRKG